MAESIPSNAVSDAPVILESSEFARFFGVLQRRGFEIVGPRVRDGAIVYDTLQSPDELPRGWTDEQGGGTYRLRRRSDDAWFGYVVGPHSWKRYLFPPEQRLFRARRTEKGIEMIPEERTVPKRAFLGVRSCELHAMAIQDRVFLGGDFRDPTYALRRENVFLIAVNCGQAGGTCFCTSMGTGPKASAGFDIAMTEILDGDGHRFLMESGTAAGAEILGELRLSAASEADHSAAATSDRRAREQMGRSLDTEGLRDLLYRNLEHPQWDRVAGRCLSCANCTMVCPTCFCSTVEDVTDLTGDHAERWRKWDSCFTVSFSHVVGGPVRSSVKSRYRQWLTHKLATWIDQFGTSGCVGCGRCITWCPVAIDLTEEVRVIRQSERRVPPPRKEVL